VSTELLHRNADQWRIHIHLWRKRWAGRLKLPDSVGQMSTIDQLCDLAERALTMQEVLSRNVEHRQIVMAEESNRRLKSRIEALEEDVKRLEKLVVYWQGEAAELKERDSERLLEHQRLVMGRILAEVERLERLPHARDCSSMLHHSYTCDCYKIQLAGIRGLHDPNFGKEVDPR